MKAAILTGGKGLRLGALTKATPKPLIKIGKKPVIAHQIGLLKRYGIKEVWLLSGYLGKQLEDYLGDGKKWGIKIHYFQENKPLGTAGAIKTLEKEIKEDFLVFSGDVMMDFDIGRFVRWHEKKKGIASFVVHPNNHPFDSDLVETDKEGKIISLLKKPHPAGLTFHNLSIASGYIFSPEIFFYIPKNRKTDIEKDILPRLLRAKKKIYIYNTPEYFKDMGTPKRLKEVKRDYAQGKISKFNLKNKRKAVFLDRDGVINKEDDHLSKIEDFKIYGFAAKAIKKINNSDYLAIIVTNQPMIAKGFILESDLNEMHKKLETELGRAGAKIDAIYICPHHPEKGFFGERPKLKIKCDCRKPKPGLLFKARKEFNLNLKKSYMIGDQTRDILAGKRAGCKTILVKTGYGGKDNLFSVKPDFIANNLFEAVRIINPAEKL